MIKKYVIIVAGGRGIRMGNEVPKQFLELQGVPILMHSINRFHLYDSRINIIVVLPVFQIEFWVKLCVEFNFTIPHTIVEGGDQRFFSVRNGLDAVTEINSVVAIHDGVRPLVSVDTIDRCFNVAISKGNAVPSVGVVDSFRVKTQNGTEIIDRYDLCLIQTPQTFQTKILKKAYNQSWNSSFTDDATVLETIGYTINLVEGNAENIKITSPNDLKFAEFLLLK